MARRPIPITGRVVAITGGARGIGRATAAALSSRGARVAIGDVDPEAAQRTADELGHGVVALPLDVTDPESFADFLEAVEERLAPIEVLVNNAGVLHIGDFADEDHVASRRQIDINLWGVLLGSKLILRRWRDQGRRGHLVNLASSAGKIAPPGIATYVATKHGVVGLTEAIRWENEDSGVEFSVVMPGVVKTEMAIGYQPTRGAKDLEPEDVAAAIAEVLQRPRFDVFVPRSLGPLSRWLVLMPRRARTAVLRAMNVHNAMRGADHASRRSYDERVEASEPALSERDPV